MLSISIPTNSKFEDPENLARKRKVHATYIVNKYFSSNTEFINEGSFGFIFFIPENQHVLKLIDLSKTSTSNINKEFQLLKYMYKKKVSVKIFGESVKFAKHLDSKFGIVEMQFYPYDLHEILEKKRHVFTKDALIWFHLTHLIRRISRANLIHVDIIATNVLVKLDEDDKHIKDMKIIDFDVNYIVQIENTRKDDLTDRQFQDCLFMTMMILFYIYTLALIGPDIENFKTQYIDNRLKKLNYLQKDIVYSIISDNSIVKERINHYHKGFDLNIFK